MQKDENDSPRRHQLERILTTEALAIGRSHEDKTLDPMIRPVFPVEFSLIKCALIGPARRSWPAILTATPRATRKIFGLKILRFLPL